jgi:DUF4097 and DUF4098 domain-containing protein YvlB
MQKTFETPGPASLYVELGSGALTIHTDDVGTTTVDVNGKDADDVLVELRGEQIVVLAPQRRSGFLGRSPEVDVHVSMPFGSRLRTKLGSADLSAMGRIGETSIKSGSGDVELEDIDGDASIETGSGDVGVRDVSGDLRLKSGSGDVHVDRISGSGSLATGSGDIRVGVALDAVQLKSGSGNAHVIEAHNDVALSTASGDIIVERAHRGEVRASNASGDIIVGIPSGVPVWTDVSTLTGSVTSNLVGAGEPEEGQPYVELRAKTVSGDVRLEQR